MARKITKADRKAAKTEETEDRDEKETALRKATLGLSQREALDMFAEAGYPVNFPGGGKTVSHVTFRDAAIKLRRDDGSYGRKTVRQAVVTLKR